MISQSKWPPLKRSSTLDITITTEISLLVLSEYARVRSDRGLRISESESKKPLNMTMQDNKILTFDGSSSLPVAVTATQEASAHEGVLVLSQIFVAGRFGL
ncbi:hypothetical protein [Methylosinus sporium]|uniref:hypothetical protein n=1 Tax=Methylosinus sporium TaxID=428 RepID=UPI00383A6FD2